MQSFRRFTPFSFIFILFKFSEHLTLHYTGFLEAVVHGGCLIAPLLHFCIFWSWCPKFALIQVRYLLYRFWTKKLWKCIFSTVISIFADDVIIFGDDVIIWKNIHNSILNCANDFKFSPWLNINNRNSSRKFCKDPTWWRHMTSFSKWRHFLNDVMWRNMTSSRRIFTKISGNVSLIDIKVWWKFEVICTI